MWSADASSVLFQGSRATLGSGKRSVLSGKADSIEYCHTVTAGSYHEWRVSFESYTGPMPTTSVTTTNFATAATGTHNRPES